MAEEYGGLRANLDAEGWTFLGFMRLLAVIVASIPLLPLQYIMVKFFPRTWWPVAGLWHRTMCQILGVRVRISKRNADAHLVHKGSVLYAANHISWLDIPVLGGHLENASFIAKSEVAGWGFIGTMCNLHKTIFVNRMRRTDSLKQRDALVDRVQEGHSLILFPEGTSTDGMNVAPFKSALFSVAERADEACDHDLLIQPVTLAYTEVNGMPLVRSQKPWVAWLGDVELFQHLRQAMGRARIEAIIEFHAPITLAEAGSRKALAAYCEQEVRLGLERAHRAEMRLGPRDHGGLLPATGDGEGELLDNGAEPA
ncbi:lysophospholipid acyltransferase family protein [Kordiimonas lipolytica]|uniref:Lysophospholipid acyltransferase family protein n=1 Tax=Kordiimonas lipolytica TaxID=1662421 RepID=A0ABV8UD88_9PROT|nr:lysophospholipid acyltransferase family protein [Kordiimonas lipolytica]